MTISVEELRADDFERLLDSDGEPDSKSTYPAIDRAFAEGWNDPNMNEYDCYEELKKCNCSITL